MPQSLAFQMVRRVHVVVHGTETPSERDWASYLGDVDKHLRAMQGILVYSHGGGPNGPQRDGLRRTYARQGIRPTAAVVTPSAFVRMIAGTISVLAGNPIRTFAPAEIDQALAFLRLDPAQQAEIKRAVETLGASVRQG